MSIWVENYGFSEESSVIINENINEFNKIAGTIEETCVKDNHECEKIKEDLKEYQ
ncbi:hypothetical protein [Bathymodiolus septemdierum thioautotrophic gill symbiont]|uniref:Uncharacterized protein n=1 Tax=endosymbiont of Bathymodiolus septemdierum str. Myojin knoll TaxID=1303921 RepID=A0A0P0UQN7_9GAMM|nr:hypothetical protein [Bathymodiolus septemdierum thioautotrophic gill symbiont]BAS67316.1 hypothetical protein BSEPE_0300 [endosymbiont of Bathymodiolus septemdierum str. Myojin knoll]